MDSKKILQWYIPIIGMILAAGMGVWHGWRFLDARAHARTLHLFRHDVSVADGIQDPVKAIRAYKALAFELPEIQIRILQRQWQVAMDMVGRIQRSKFRTELAPEAPEQFAKLLKHLDDMRDRCGILLTETPSASPELLWQAHNILAAVRLLCAFATLETESNWPKAQGMIREGMTELKTAIETVDQLPRAGLFQNIPRWNMELLYAQQYVEKYSMFNPENQTRMDLNENLEMLIPERGGYAPGEPADRSVKK